MIRGLAAEREIIARDWILTGERVTVTHPLADIVSFWLKPFGFFDRNPALDVPPSPHHG